MLFQDLLVLLLHCLSDLRMWAQLLSYVRLFATPWAAAC